MPSQIDRADPHEDQGPERKILLGDWQRIAKPEAGLLLELDRFNPRERVPNYRLPLWRRAKAIIEGRQAWPRELLPWRTWRELRYFHCGRGTLPAWHDPMNLTRPKRERLQSEERQWRREDDRRARIAGLLS